MQWIDKDKEEQQKATDQAWAGKASSLGWYDYLYGTPYLIPRVYFHQLAENYRYAAATGVRAQYAEAYPNWGEGPKLYVALKLQWNPGLDLDALLNDWYVAAVGDAAAPYLAAYFHYREEFWTKRVPNGKWFSAGRTYLRFYDPSYLDLVTLRDIEISRDLLDATAARAETPPQKARAQILQKAFEYYEASVISYIGANKPNPDGNNRAMNLARAKAKRYDLVEEFAKDPVLVHPIRFDNDKRFKQLSW